MTEIHHALQMIIDRQAITDVLLRYARGADRLDIDCFRSVFWEDGGYEDSVVEGEARDFIPSLIGDTVRSFFDTTQHFISNVRIDFEGADLAFTECYFLAFHVVPANREALDAVLGPERMAELGADYTRRYEIFVAGRYLDRFERRRGEWRVKKRRLVADWTTTAPYSGIGRKGLAALWKLFGIRDRSDPSYLRR